MGRRRQGSRGGSLQARIPSTRMIGPCRLPFIPIVPIGKSDMELRLRFAKSSKCRVQQAGCNVRLFPSCSMLIKLTSTCSRCRPSRKRPPAREMVKPPGHKTPLHLRSRPFLRLHLRSGRRTRPRSRLASPWFSASAHAATEFDVRA